MMSFNVRDCVLNVTMRVLFSLNFMFLAPYLQVW